MAKVVWRGDVTDDTGLAQLRLRRGRGPDRKRELRLLVDGHETNGRPVAVSVVVPLRVAEALSMNLQWHAT